MKSYRLKRVRWVLLACVVLVVPGRLCLGETIDEMLRLYQDMRYVRAKRIAGEHMEDPRGKLVYHLCELFDSAHKAIPQGLKGLRELYQDQTVREAHPLVWAEAGLSFGRVIQVDQWRTKAEGRSQLPKEHADEDVRAVFSDIVARTPESAQGAMAVIYLGETYFRNGDKAQHDAGFELVEKYLAGQGASAKHTVPVHLYIESQYINHRGDYGKSFEHLKQAYELGVVKEMLRRVVLFRMARMCDIKLKRKGEARRYYEKFLVDYPFAKRTPLVKRYLKAFEGK